MKLGLLFSGGKDSTLAGYFAIKEGYKINCLISIFSKNSDSYMFHTPFIEQVFKQAESMDISFILQETDGEKEKELLDLEKAIKKAKKDFNIEGIVTGAVESVYQSIRIQRICDKLGLFCFNPLWQKPQLDILKTLVDNKFNVILISTAAEGFNSSWLGRRIDDDFIRDIKLLNEKYKISVSGEGGEFETFVLDCPIFKKKINLDLKKLKVFGDENNLRFILK